MHEESLSIHKTAAGIPVVVDLVPGARIAGYLACAHTGSRDESPSQGGISHLLEHVVFRGTETRSSLEIARSAEVAGGHLNAFTSKEMTAYYGTSIDRSSAVVQDLVADIFSYPLLRQEDIDTEKKIVLQEIGMWENDPESYIHKLFFETLWDGHPLSQSEAGEEEVVMALTEDDLRSYHQERYRAPNIAVFASGKVDPEQTVAWAEECFDPLQGGKDIKRESPRPTGESFRVFTREGEQSYVGMGFPAYGPADPRRDALRLMSVIMGGGMSSRLFQSVREERGLVYSIYNSGGQYSDAGSLGTFFSTTAENVEEAMGIVAREWRQLKDEGLLPDELRKAKNLVGGSLASSMESTSSRLHRLTRDFALTGAPRTLDETLERLEAVSEEDVMAVAEDILCSSRLAVAIYGQESESLLALRGSLEI